MATKKLTSTKEVSKNSSGLTGSDDVFYNNGCKQGKELIRASIAMGDDDSISGRATAAIEELLESIKLEGRDLLHSLSVMGFCSAVAEVLRQRRKTEINVIKHKGEKITPAVLEKAEAEINEAAVILSVLKDHLTLNDFGEEAPGDVLEMIGPNIRKAGYLADTAGHRLGATLVSGNLYQWMGLAEQGEGVEHE